MDTQSSSLPISLNCRVLVELVDTSGQAERSEFILVPADQADLKSGLLDENTPLGRTLMGRHAGEKVPYRAGDLKEVRILAVQPGDGAVSSGAADKRREDVRKAAAQSEITNQMIFATASGSKWGDYDVDMDKLLGDDNQAEPPPAKDFTPLHFIDLPIQVSFEVEPARQKTPPCPDGFVWDGKEYRITEKLSEWKDFARRGRMARNMQPAHAAVAAEHGSLGVGRFYFRVRVGTGQVFDLYYDRLIKNVDDRLGHWVLYRELSEK
jgi:Family of unknown function (DUF6504)/Transcription elongation factor, GreA/GreB, C-term